MTGFVDLGGTVPTVSAVALLPAAPRLDEFQKTAVETLEAAMAGWKALRARLESCPASWHPNGFAVFILGTVRGCWPIRLHVWVPGSPGLQTWHPPVHSHDRDIVSLMLSGAKTDIRWNQAGGALDQEIYTVERAKSDFEVLYPTGRLTVVERSSADRHSRGEYITQAAGTLHEIPPPPREWFATLCVKSEVVDPVLQYVIDNVGCGARTVERVPIGVGNRRALLSLIDGDTRG